MITSADLNNALTSGLLNGIGSAWIGLQSFSNDLQVGKFAWSDFAPELEVSVNTPLDTTTSVVYEAFASGRPMIGSGQDCVLINGDSEWLDKDCTNQSFNAIYQYSRELYDSQGANLAAVLAGLEITRCVDETGFELFTTPPPECPQIPSDLVYCLMDQQNDYLDHYYRAAQLEEQSEIEGLEGSLAIINSLNLNKILTSLLVNEEVGRAWIGLQRIISNSDGGFVWVDFPKPLSPSAAGISSTTPFQPECSGFDELPSVEEGGDAKCVVINSNSTWTAVNCGSTERAIYQFANVEVLRLLADIPMNSLIRCVDGNGQVTFPDNGRQ